MGELMERTRSVPVRLRYLILLATVSGGSLLLLCFNNNTEIMLLNNEALSSSWEYHRYDVDDSESFTIKTEGCTIPGMNAFDENVRKFMEHPKHLKLKTCRHAKFPLLANNETHIWIKNENLYHYQIPNDHNITCCYKSFYRPSAVVDISSIDIDDRVQYEACVIFSNYIEVLNEFVKVSCIYDHKTVYEQFFIFAPKKPLVTYKDDTTEGPQNQSSYNVIVMGIDAISRLNFHRTMPKTLAYLRKKGALELLGYNKVGDNTFPNLTPMLLGIKDTDLEKTCWPNHRATFDNCPFIWEWFKHAGYYTALGEDSASLGTFNFLKFGFSRTPTDYYIHTFMHEAEMFAGNNKDFNSFLCMGDKYFYQVLLDYIENLTTTLKSSRLFGFFWEVTMSHDHLNYPMVMDESYEKFLKTLDKSNYFDDTILILLSDHGIRWGKIRYTKQGRLEERLPFVFILVPPSFQEEYSIAYNNLKLNRRQLTTPFDMYATLSDLVNLENIKNEMILSRSNNSYAQDRSISLFLPIPGNRTCKTAGIDDHWCTCHRGLKLSRDSVEAVEAAAHLVRQLNVILRKHSQCAQLMLAEVVEVTEMMAGMPGEKEVGWREFMVVVRTTPGGGVFEATLRHDSREWALAGTVSRLNLYGNQSHCVHHYQLKLYCFCH